MVLSLKRGQVDLTTLGIALLALALITAIFYYFFLQPKEAFTLEQKLESYKPVNVQLRAIKTMACVNNETIFELSFLNPIVNPPAYVQLAIEVPPGVVVYAAQAKATTGYATLSLKLEPGDVQSVRVRIIGIEPGEKVISGYVYYWFEGESRKEAKVIKLDFPVTFVNCK